MSELNIVIAVISALILLFGFIKRRMDKSFLSEPLLALSVGILIGPEVTGWVDWRAWDNPFELLHQFTRFTISLALMATALRLSRNYLRTKSRTYLTVLFGGIILMASLASILYLIVGFSFWKSILLGAIITPTDPILATIIVSGSYAEKTVPDYMRHTLSFESASNDGLAYPLVLLPTVFLHQDHAFTSWLTKILLWENAGAVILGGIIGYLFSKLFNYFYRKDWIEIKALLAVFMVLAFLLTTSFSMIDMNGIIGVFAAGLVFSIKVDKHVDVREERIQSMMDFFFVVPVFVLLGLMLPWEKWAEMPLVIWIISPFAIFIRRIPALFILKPMIGIFSKKDVIFAGWFGPIGVASIFYVTLIITRYPGNEFLWPIVTYIVCSSTIIHAISAFPFTRYIYEKEEAEPGENKP